jgi:hypothetical protein
MGNLLVQAFASGRLDSIDEMRAVIKRSVTVTEFTPNSDSPLSDRRMSQSL